MTRLSGFRRVTQHHKQLAEAKIKTDWKIFVSWLPVGVNEAFIAQKEPQFGYDKMHHTGEFFVPKFCV
jgi:hypothetical protein